MIVEDFLAKLRRHIEAQAPHLSVLFDVMAAEARFARAWLEDDLVLLPMAARVLEVGGGTFLLTCQLVREGYDVTAIEPIGSGFGSFEELGSLVLAFAAREGIEPRVARCRAEDFDSDNRFAMAFSVNVMEHVESPQRAIERVSAVLSPGGSYRFLCPNYLFPYEPHFNIPTAGSKSLTQRLMWGRIAANTNLEDPKGVWESLNWITLPKVRRIARADPSLTVRFQTNTVAWMLKRAVSDSEFARRRAPWMVAAIRMLNSLRILGLASIVPATCQPIIDARLTKRH